jgi:chromosome partitioning protein
MKTIAVMNQKGGTGKTTSVINLAGELTRRGKRVLIMDMDTQGNATSNLQLTEVPETTLADVIVGKTATLADTICKTSVEHLDLIRGGALLAPALSSMQEMTFGRDTTLRRLLPQLPDTYDFVLFDCSPSLESLFNINVLVAVQYVLIPIKVDKNSIEGYDVMLETIQSVREIANPDIRALGIFMTAVETGSSLDREMIANLPSLLPDLAFRTFIRKNIDVKKAPLALQPLCYFSPRCTATEDYAALTDELLARMEAQENG